jgi:hypothetical protein
MEINSDLTLSLFISNVVYQLDITMKIDNSVYVLLIIAAVTAFIIWLINHQGWNR